MRLTMPRTALFNALTLVNVAVPSRPSVPILSGVLVTATSGGVTFRGTDWDTYATADVDADVSLSGTVAVSARALTDWEKTLPKSVHTVALTLVDGCTLRVAGADERGTGYREIPTMPVEDFPPDIETVSGLGTVPLSDLVATVKATAPAASTDQTLPNMCALHMSATGHTLSVDASDRYRLASVDLTWSPAGANNDWSALVDAKTLVAVTRAMVKIAGRKLPGSVTVGARYAGLENAFFGMTYAAGDGAYYVLKIRSRDVSGFPRVRGLYPDNAVTTVTVDGAHLVDLVKRVSDMKATIPVILTFDGKTVTAEFGESERVPGEPAAREIGDLVDLVDGPPVTVGFRPAFLVAGIDMVGGGHVTLTMVDGFKPAVIAPVDGGKQNHTLPAGAVRHLIMPIRTTGRAVKPAVGPVGIRPASESAIREETAATAPAPVTAPHAYVSFGGSSARRCGLVGCDRGKTAAIHRVTAVEPAATAPVPHVDQVDQAAPVTVVEPAATAVDQADQDTAPVAAVEPAATAPVADVDQVDQAAPVPAVTDDVRALIAAGVWNVEHVTVGRRPRRNAPRVMVYVMRLPESAGRLPRDTYEAVAAQLKALGSLGWNGNARGFTFETGDSGNMWRAATPSGRERVSAWIAATAPVPAVDQVDQDATVPAVTVDQVDQGETVTAVEPAATAPVGYVAPVPTPADFAPYMDEIRGCRDRFCLAVAGAVRAGEPVDGPARLLLAALRTGYHVRTGDAPAVDQGETVTVVEPGVYPYAAIWDRPTNGPRVLPMSSVGLRVAYRRDDVTVIGPVNFEPGMVRVRMADGTVQRAMVCDVKRVDQVDAVPAPRALVDASALALVTGIVPDRMAAPILPAGMLASMPDIPTPADFRPYRDEIKDGCQCTVCLELAYNGHHYSDKHAARRAARVLLAHLVAGTHQRVTIAEVAAFARTAKAARLEAARAAGAPAAEIAGIERGYATVKMSDFYATGMGLGIGPRAVVDQDTAPVPAVDQVDQGETVTAIAEDVSPVDTSAPTVDQADDVTAVDQVSATPMPREVAVRVTYAAPVPAVDQADDAAPAAAGTGHVTPTPDDQDGTPWAHPQRVHVSGIGEGDGYRFHLVAGANGRALAKEVKPVLARMRRELGAAFYVTSPRKSGTVNVVPHPGNTVKDWRPVLALFHEMIGAHIVPAGECGACDRSAALVDA